jgi:hypothetical protein
MGYEIMKKGVVRKSIVLGIIFILMVMSIVPIQASENKKDISPQTTHENGENILGYITVKWQSFFATFNLSDLRPIIIFNQSDTRDFYFPEIDGIVQLNFTVVCRQRLENRTLFPRFTRYEFSIKYNGDFLFNCITKFYPCWTLKWKYNDIIQGPKDTINDVHTNGQNVTLSPLLVGVRTIPGNSSWGDYDDWEPITIHPIPTPP